MHTARTAKAERLFVSLRTLAVLKEAAAQVCFRVRAMDKYLNLVRLPLNASDAVGPKGFQALLLGPGNNEQVGCQQPMYRPQCPSIECFPFASMGLQG